MDEVYRLLQDADQNPGSSTTAGPVDSGSSTTAGPVDSGSSTTAVENKNELLEQQLFDDNVLRLWRTGALYLAWNSKEDTPFDVGCYLCDSPEYLCDYWSNNELFSLFRQLA